MEIADEKNLRFRLVGSFLKNKRIAAGLTQREIANALSYNSPQFISNWERGISLPPLDALPILTNLFRVSAHDMIQVMSQYQGELLKQHQQQLAIALSEAHP